MSEILISPPKNLIERAEAEEYGVTDAVRLIIGSFRFSQGSPGLQECLLDWVSYFTQDKISADTLEQSIGPATEAAAKILSNRKMHSRVSVEGNRAAISRQIIEFVNYFESRITAEAQEVHVCAPSLEYLTSMLIERDYNRLIIRQRQREYSERLTPATDPNLSQFVYFGLMRQSTGIKEYDQIFGMARETYLGQLRSASHYRIPKETKEVELVEELVKKQLADHPDQINLLPEEFRHLSLNLKELRIVA